MEVALLADRPDLIAPLAAAYQAEWPDWYGPAGPGDAHADLHDRARREGLPLGLVLTDGDDLLGAVAITGPSIGRYAHLTPWVGGGWTRPDRRRQGLGAALLDGAVQRARAMGFKRLHVATATAPSLMQRQGWTLLETAEHDGHALSVFVLDLD
jgi:GNAT superfamily N-acetyltransferase